MLGDIVLTKIWGGLDSNRGNIRHYVCKNYDEANYRLQIIVNQRARKGYIRSLN
jgi:hypothetical protein